MSEENDVVGEAIDSPERRDFLAKAGRFAVVTPAAVTVLLNTTMKAEAHGIFKSPGQPTYRKKKKFTRRIKRINRRHEKILARLWERWFS